MKEQQAIRENLVSLRNSMTDEISHIQVEMARLSKRMEKLKSAQASVDDAIRALTGERKPARTPGPDGTRPNARRQRHFDRGTKVEEDMFVPRPMSTKSARKPAQADVLVDMDDWFAYKNSNHATSSIGLGNGTFTTAFKKSEEQSCVVAGHRFAWFAVRDDLPVLDTQDNTVYEGTGHVATELGMARADIVHSLLFEKEGRFRFEGSDREGEDA